MKQNAPTREEYMVTVLKDLHDLRARIVQSWADPNTEPSVAAYQATEAVIVKHQTIVQDYLAGVTS